MGLHPLSICDIKMERYRRQWSVQHELRMPTRKDAQLVLRGPSLPQLLPP
jgi:hypothetical protein